MVSNSDFQCIQSSNSSNLQTFKLPDSQTFKLSSLENFKLSTPQSLKPFELSNFEPFELSIFQTPWVSNFQTPSSQTFELKPEGCSVNPYAFSSGPSPCSLAQRVAAASNFQAGFPFKLSNSKLAPTFKLETLKLQTLHSPNFSNAQTFQSRPTYNTLKLSKIRVQKTPLVTPLNQAPMLR